MLPLDADMAKLVDALDLGSSVERRGGSSPSIRTKTKIKKCIKANCSVLFKVARCRNGSLYEGIFVVVAFALCIVCLCADFFLDPY